jgi:hypothetical protein
MTPAALDMSKGRVPVSRTRKAVPILEAARRASEVERPPSGPQVDNRRAARPYDGLRPTDALHCLRLKLLAFDIGRRLARLESPFSLAVRNAGHVVRALIGFPPDGLI